MGKEFVPSVHNTRKSNKMVSRVWLIESRQSAIVRGAALRGLVGIAPRKKYCRRHYGFVVGMPFREGIDPESSSMVDPYNYTKLCTNRMLWLINKVRPFLGKSPSRPNWCVGRRNNRRNNSLSRPYALSPSQGCG